MAGCNQKQICRNIKECLGTKVSKIFYDSSETADDNGRGKQYALSESPASHKIDEKQGVDVAERKNNNQNIVLQALEKGSTQNQALVQPVYFQIFFKFRLKALQDRIQGVVEQVCNHKPGDKSNDEQHAEKADAF